MAVNETNVWAINGPVETDARQAREIAWIATGGQTGVIGPDSLEVKAQPTPDGSVRVLPGSFAAQATPGDSGAGYASAPWQTYMRAIYQTTSRNINPTDSTGPRTDVVGIEIVDPQFEGTDTSGWTDADWASHSFWRVRVKENASPDATIITHFPSMTRPFVPLARITIPASTGTITDDMITDLRFLAVQRTDSDSILQRPTTSYTINVNDETNLGGMEGPVVPQWATHVKLDGEIIGAAATGTGDVEGAAKFVVKHYGGHGNPETPYVFFSASGAWDRFDIPAFGRVRIHSEERGKPLNLWFKVTMTGGDGSISIAQTKTAMRVRLTFTEEPTAS